MMDISNVLSSMDKRMAYNLRLISSVTYGCHDQFHKDSKNASDDLIKILQSKTTEQKIAKIKPKIKEMSNWTIQKLNMSEDEGHSILRKYD